MRFRVNKASGTEPPCEGAVFGKYSEEHIVDLSKVQYNFKDKVIDIWKTHGVNQRREGDLLIKYFEYDVWWLEINNLKELMNFIKKEGHIVLASDEITIYDDYLE